VSLLQVDHKRTFYLLEQMILKYKAHQQTTSVKEVPDGIDFYFLHRNHAVKFQEFLTSVIPCRPKSASEKVLSEDLNNNKVNAKYTFSVEIVPICKDDVICLHPRQHASNGNIGPIVLCSGVTQSVKLLDPTTMQRGELRQEAYYKNARAAIMTLKQATEYTVLDSELTGLSAGKMQQAELTLARTRDLGSNDERFRALTHLGHLLQVAPSPSSQSTHAAAGVRC
jgi:nonsense-mediated mRNA decay protein 3